MARNVGTSVENNFSRGLITEATAMTFPENAVVSCSNVIFDKTGKVSRRLGIDLEEDYVWENVVVSNSVFKEYVWTVVGSDISKSFLVVQNGRVIYFYKMDINTAASADRMAFTINLDTYLISGAPSAVSEEASFTSGKGYLFITHPYCDPIYVSYDNLTDTLEETQFTIQIRDFEGVEDSLATIERPTTLSNEHKYNLKNQGWTDEAVAYNISGTLVNPLDWWFADVANYPSNGDVFWLYKNADNTFIPANQDGSADFLGDTPAPKGHFIINPFDSDRNTQAGTTGVTERNSSYQRPATCAFFAGRVFYAGVNYSGFVSEIYFSKVIEATSDFGKCFQVRDPTSEHVSDLLSTDGGVIKILDIGKVHSMFTTQKALLVFASNGIWSISGSDVTSFKADDYTVKRISSINIPSATSVVSVLSAPVFLGVDGIWTVEYSNGDFNLKNLSNASVKGYLNKFSYEAKVYSKGVYNSNKNVVTWLLSSVTPNSIDTNYNYDTAVNLDLATGAFYPYSFDTTTHKIKGIFTKVGQSVQIGGPAEEYAASTTTADTTKFIVAERISGATYKITFAEEKDTTYHDFVSTGSSKNFSSFFISGYKLKGEGARETQSNYLTIVAENIEDASAFIRGVWDYTTAAVDNKWTSPQQIYLAFNDDRSYITRKIKIRGWGKSLQFYVYSEEGKPFGIVGFITQDSVNSAP